MIGNFLGDVEKPHSYVKTAVATFWNHLGYFTATSGHTGCNREVNNKMIKEWISACSIA